MHACTQVWIEGGTRPEIGNHHSAEVIGNQLYLIGGLRGTSSLADVQIGTLSAAGGGAVTINWVQGADAPVATGSAVSALIDGEVLPRFLCVRIASYLCDSWVQCLPLVLL